MSRQNASNTRTARKQPTRRLLLFIAEGEPNSLIACENLQRICDAETDLEIEVRWINVFEDHHPALAHGVLLTPCLIMEEPPPRVMVVGTLDDTGKVRAALRLKMGAMQDA